MPIVKISGFSDAVPCSSALLISVVTKEIVGSVVYLE